MKRSKWSDEISGLIPGIDASQYADAFGLGVILWRGIWYSAAMDWSRYRRRIWEMYGNWLQSAARRSRDLNAFISNFARLATLREVGTNVDEREAVAAMLALPPDEQRRIIRQFRENTPIITTLVRLYRDKHRAELEAQMEEAYS